MEAQQVPAGLPVMLALLALRQVTSRRHAAATRFQAEGGHEQDMRAASADPGPAMPAAAVRRLGPAGCFSGSVSAISACIIIPP